MSTLRVLLAAAPSPARADAWALFDAAGRRERVGHDVPGSWPDTTAREAVLAASAVRLVALELPPMTAELSTGAATQPLDGSTQVKPLAPATTLVACVRRLVRKESCE